MVVYEQLTTKLCINYQNLLICNYLMKPCVIILKFYVLLYQSEFEAIFFLPVTCIYVCQQNLLN